jgi:hypothetical protein
MHAPPNGWGCSCRIFGARNEAGIRRVGGVPGKDLPPGWDAVDPRTGAQVGIDNGWGYAPGASVAEDVLALRGKLDQLPEKPSVDLIQSWLASDGFAKWLAAPSGNWPLVRIPAADAEKLGAQKAVADLSDQTAIKQLREHPDMTLADYAQAQQVVSKATRTIQDTPTSMVYVFEAEGENGYVLVVKATRTGLGLFVTSFRKLSRVEAEADREVRRLLRRSVE